MALQSGMFAVTSGPGRGRLIGKSPNARTDAGAVDVESAIVIDASPTGADDGALPTVVRGGESGGRIDDADGGDNAVKKGEKFVKGGDGRSSFPVPFLIPVFNCAAVASGVCKTLSPGLAARALRFWFARGRSWGVEPCAAHIAANVPDVRASAFPFPKVESKLAAGLGKLVLSMATGTQNPIR